MSMISDILDPIAIPKMGRVRQVFDRTRVEDVGAELRRQLNREEIAATLRPGMSVAITAGSRGIYAYAEIIREVVAFVRSRGAEPFIVPAMGSHGGATAAGQTRVLAGHGITEEAMGAPIRATMEVTEVGCLPDGTSVSIDAYAAAADGIIVVNRVKPHPAFRGRYESGLYKMMAVGLGKQKGADAIHDRGTANMDATIEAYGGCILRNAKILFGVATVENAFDETCRIEALLPAEITAREPELLEEAKARLPKIFFEHLDVLIVDQVGKDISGTGMDANITFTFPEDSVLPRDGRAKRIVVFDLSEGTHGNSAGLTHADTTTRRAIEKVDREEGYPNLLTIGAVESLPMYFDNQRQAIQAAIKTLPADRRAAPRMVRMKDTLHATELQVSESLWAEALADPRVEIVSEPEPLPFNEAGDLF